MHKPKNILLAGGTGLIGSRLAAMLRERGFAVRLLSRRADVSQNIFGWNPTLGEIDPEALRDVDFVVNLAGAGIADGRWTAARKRAIAESRIQSARTLRAAIERAGHLPKVYLSASAIGFYGNSGELLMHEDAPPGLPDFMAEVCQDWEKAADEIAALGVRTAKFRIGIVLAKEGGALAEIAKPTGFGIGAYFADGQGWQSWIHRDDLCRMFIYALENEAVSGVFNAVAPSPARNVELVKMTARALRRRVLLLPVPAFALRLLLGEMAVLLLHSTRVSAAKIKQARFRFQFPDLASALENLCSARQDGTQMGKDWTRI